MYEFLLIQLPVLPPYRAKPVLTPTLTHHHTGRQRGLTFDLHTTSTLLSLQSFVFNFSKEKNVLKLYSRVTKASVENTMNICFWTNKIFPFSIRMWVFSHLSSFGKGFYQHLKTRGRLEICQKFYTTEFSGPKFYTLKTRKLRLFC